MSKLNIGRYFPKLPSISIRHYNKLLTVYEDMENRG
jgi:hypothetical protein